MRDSGFISTGPNFAKSTSGQGGRLKGSAPPPLAAAGAAAGWGVGGRLRGGAGGDGGGGGGGGGGSQRSHRRFRRRRLRRRGVRLVIRSKHQDRRILGHLVADLDLDFFHHAGRRRGDFHGRLVRLQRDQRLLLGNGVARLD